MKEEFIIVSNKDAIWKEIYTIAQSDYSHPLWKNYQEINLDDYIVMIVYTIDGRPAGFSGVYNNPDIWPSNFARFGNRTYIAPRFRSAGATDILYKNFKYVLDNYDKWEVDVLFFSIELHNDPKSEFNKFKFYNKYNEKKTGYRLEFDDRIYQCCNSYHPKCYHFCSWYNPKNLKIDVKNYDKEVWHLFCLQHKHHLRSIL